MNIFKFLKSFWIEILIGAILLFAVDDIRWFLFYFLVIVLATIHYKAEYLRKLIRVFQVVNEGKLLGIIKKLNISEEELQDIGDSVEANLTEKQLKSLYKDMEDIGLK